MNKFVVLSVVGCGGQADRSGSYYSGKLYRDTRTGIVPFTMVVSKTFTAEERQGDMSFYETIHKAELVVLERGLADGGDGVIEFFGGGEGEVICVFFEGMDLMDGMDRW